MVCERVAIRSIYGGEVINAMQIVFCYDDKVVNYARVGEIVVVRDNVLYLGLVPVVYGN